MCVLYVDIYMCVEDVGTGVYKCLYMGDPVSGSVRMCLYVCKEE